MRRSLGDYAPIMVGGGALLLLIDILALLLRTVGISKWTAIYLALLLGIGLVTVAFQRWIGR